jgi:hypothetical protein
MKVYEQKKKNLLIFVNNVYAAINMSCYLQNKEFGKITVVIERITSESVASFTTIKLPKTNKKVELIKKIFLGFGVDKILIYNRPTIYHSFDIKSFLNFFLYIKKNMQIRNNFLYFLNKNNPDKFSYDEIWCSNELLAKMYIDKSFKKITYFFHGVGDVMLVLKKNFLLNFFCKIKFFINLTFFKYYFFYNNKKITFVNLFSFCYPKKNFAQFNIINKKIYLKTIYKILKNIKLKKRFNNMIVISDSIVRQNFSDQQAKQCCDYYATRVINYFKKNYKNVKLNFVLKWKNSANSSHIRIMKNSFKKRNVRLYESSSVVDGFLPLDLFCHLTKPKFILSSFQTIDYIAKKFLVTTRIVNTDSLQENFSKIYTQYYNRNNLANVAKNSNRMKKIITRVYDLKIN